MADATGELAVVSHSALVSRARVARLTLQLLAATREAAEAERDEAAVNRDEELAVARARRQGLLDERRQLLEVELAEAGVEAAAEVDAARCEAASIVAAAEHEVAAARTAAAADAQAAVHATSLTDLPVWEPSPPDAAHRNGHAAREESTPAPAPPAQATPSTSAPAAIELARPAVSMTMDAAEFAGVIATALAKVLEQQNASFRAVLQTMQVPLQQQQQYRPRQRTPMRHALHLDVVLSGLAALFVLVILLAWLG